MSDRLLSMLAPLNDDGAPPEVRRMIWEIYRRSYLRRYAAFVWDRTRELENRRQIPGLVISQQEQDELLRLQAKRAILQARYRHFLD